MNDLSPRLYKEILRLDLGYFAERCFCELNPQAFVRDAGRPVSYDALSVDAAHAEVFDFEEFLDAVLRAFSADAAFLHAAEGADLAGGPVGEVMPSLMPTTPYSRDSATRQMRPMRCCRNNR